MLTALIAFSALRQSTQAASGPAPADLVSRMLARYAGANSLSGKLTYNQEAKGSVQGQAFDKVIHGETDVQYQRPNKLYVRQAFEDGQGTARIVSDGTAFVYNVPQNLMSGRPDQELVEPVQQSGKVLDIAQIYNIGGSGLVIKPVPLDITIGRTGDLKLFRAQLVTLEDQGDETINGAQAHLVGGDWRQYDTAPVSGKYQLAINDSGDLLRYTVKERVADAEVKLDPVDVTTTWTVNFQVNGPVDQSLFKR